VSNEPVFIVGVQRSGTTLLAAMLAAHSRLSCGPETHFFRRLAAADVARLCQRATWPEAAADFLASITHVGFSSDARVPLLAKYQLDPAVVRAYLAAHEPRVASILGAVTEPYMLARQKARWVEKTPDHLLHLPAIREHFPRSPIIRIVRDPRDVSLSLMNVPWGVRSFAEGLFYWERLDRASRQFFTTDTGSLTVRFEDLVSAPEATLGRICDFIGERFEEGMLDTSSTGAEIDRSRVEAWRASVSPREDRMAEALLGDRLQAFGYARDHAFSHVADVLPSIALAERYPGAIETLAAEGVRFWRERPDEPTSVTVYLGDPGSRDWFGGAAPIGPARVLADVARAAASGRRLYWVTDTAANQWTGSVPFLLKTCLTPFRVQGCAPVSA
jgi:hypothetical protein